MPISTVAVDEAIKASTENKILAHVNGSPGRAIFTSNGTFAVPAGVYQFKVSLAGGGGGSGTNVSSGGFENIVVTGGGPGGDSPLASKIITGQDIGTSFNIVIGAGSTGTGGTSTFGALLQSTGGLKGATGDPTGVGARGTHNGDISLGSETFVNASGIYYGKGGRSGMSEAGGNGICVIEW